MVRKTSNLKLSSVKIDREIYASVAVKKQKNNTAFYFLCGATFIYFVGFLFYVGYMLGKYVFT